MTPTILPPSRSSGKGEMTLHRYAAELVIFGNATMVCPSRDLCDAAQQRFEELYPELIGKGHFIVLSEQRREGLP